MGSKFRIPVLAGEPASRAFAADEGGKGLIEGGVASNPDPAVGQLVDEQLNEVRLRHTDK